MKFWIVALVALMTTLGGCATVRSTTPQTSETAGGLTYYLPTRWVRLTATRTVIKLEDAVKARDAKQGALAAARQQAAEAKIRREQAQAVLLALDAAAPNRAALSGAVFSAQAEEAVANARVVTVTTELEAANALVAELTVRGTVCSYAAKLELLPAQPDPTLRYVARTSHNIFRDDVSTLRVTPSGLLTSANVVAADRTSDIIAEFAGGLAGLGSGTGPELVATEIAEDCAIQARQSVHIFDPVASGELTRVSDALKAAKFPLQVVSSETQASAQAYPAMEAPRLRKPFNGALFYRSPQPVLLAIQQDYDPGTKENWVTVDAALVLLPQAGPVSYIPMNSSAFVRTVNDVQFTDGVITSWTAERPSEFLEIVKLPVRVLTDLISVPARLFSVQVDYSSAAEALALAQRSQMVAEAERNALRDCFGEGGEDVIARCLAD
ncbi:MAG: hypothetical protein K2X25_08340 [Caulobacteraceae bacterium]|nr:hypothetical protein [Caulobacteraceae bacterium]